jgi:hypothetical protein
MMSRRVSREIVRFVLTFVGISLIVPQHNLNARSREQQRSPHRSYPGPAAAANIQYGVLTLGAGSAANVTPAAS